MSPHLSDKPQYFFSDVYGSFSSCMSVHHMLTWCPQRPEEKRILDPWNWNYTWMVMSHDGNWTQVLLRAASALTTESFSILVPSFYVGANEPNLSDKHLTGWTISLSHCKFFAALHADFVVIAPVCTPTNSEKGFPLRILTSIGYYCSWW